MLPGFGTCRFDTLPRLVKMVSGKTASFLSIARPQSSKGRFNTLRRRFERSISKKCYRKYWLSGIQSLWNPSWLTGRKDTAQTIILFSITSSTRYTKNEFQKTEILLSNWNVIVIVPLVTFTDKFNLVSANGLKEIFAFFVFLCFCRNLETGPTISGRQVVSSYLCWTAKFRTLFLQR